MRRSQRLQLVFMAVLTFSAAVAAKCPTGTVTVHGRVDNLPSNRTGMEATVVVEGKNGTVSRTALVTNQEFTIEVPFSTTSSSSFLLGDRCKAVPKFVEVKIVSEGKIYAQKKLDFKHSFEMSDPHQYRLKQELSLDVKSGSS